MAEDNNNQNGNEKENEKIHDIVPVSGLYENWFLEYASYVILERAVPALEDGLKPVQRRILHSMKQMDDGRYHKVANIIGHTMQYHPHGDAAIGDALVNMGQKDLLIDAQGNWGDVRTGDSAAAPRYIEARLSKFALDVVFNPDTTEWQASYDGRNKEPVTLPVKFPLVLTQGADGIAVGLSTKILPHNFCELIEGSIKILKGRKPTLYPDFMTGGYIDVENYNDGKRGGKVRVRAKIEVVDKKTLAIKEIPYGNTTTSLMESIVKANDSGKIKIKKVIDNTAKEVEILVSLAPGISPELTIDALYAFTNCEVSISPNICLIFDDKPHFLSVAEVLKISTDHTLELLKRELEIKKAELLEKLLFSSLEKIFIENRIYRDIEECETWEAVIKTIDKGLDPFKKDFYREITEEDIVRLTEIKIKRISKFDTFKADELMRKLEEELKETEHHLANLTDYAIAYFQRLLDKYGKGRERKTEIKTFDTVSAQVVAVANEKLYVNRQDGFIGFGLKKDEFVSECSDLDDVIAFMKDGTMKVSKVADKVFMGKNILYTGVFKKNDERMVYNMIYVDAGSGRAMGKRFQVSGITRDKVYDLTKGVKGSQVLYFSANPNGEAEVVNIKLSQSSRARIKVFDFDFAELDIKGRGSQGNIVTKYPVKKIELKSEGVSTLGGVDRWYDDVTGRLNTDERGKYLGEFDGEDNIIVIYKDGSYELTSFDITNKYDPDKVVLIAKFDPKKVISAVHYDGKTKNWYVKRFQVETTTVDKPFIFISEESGSKLGVVSMADKPVVQVDYKKSKGAKKYSDEIPLDEFIDVKGWKSIGNKLSNYPVSKVSLVEDEEVVEKKKSTPSETEPGKESKKQDQGSLFEEKEKEEKPESKSTETEAKEEKEEPKKEQPKKEEKKSSDGGTLNIGETIELDLSPKKKDDD